LLKRLVPLKRSHVFCVRIIGKMPEGHLMNWSHPINGSLKGVNVQTHLKDLSLKGGLQGAQLPRAA
jgi:hypothetical protein